MCLHLSGSIVSSQNTEGNEWAYIQTLRVIHMDRNVVSGFVYHHCLSLNPTYTVSLAVASWPIHALRDIFVRVSLINSPVEQKFKGLHKVQDYKCGNCLWHTAQFQRKWSTKFVFCHHYGHWYAICHNLSNFFSSFSWKYDHVGMSY